MGSPEIKNNPTLRLKVGQKYIHDQGLHYQLDSIGVNPSAHSGIQDLLDVTGYEENVDPKPFDIGSHSEEELEQYVLYTQLEEGSYPAGQRWVREKNDFVAHFTEAKNQEE